jgi:hypothetical protein
MITNDITIVNCKTIKQEDKKQTNIVKKYKRSYDLKHHRNLGIFLLVYKLCVPRETTYDKTPQKSGNVSSSI